MEAYLGLAIAGALAFLIIVPLAHFFDKAKKEMEEAEEREESDNGQD